jgi:2'-5' RNA ligase
MTPPNKISKEINSVAKKISKKFKIYSALALPPHITLIRTLYVPEKDVQGILEETKNIIKKQKPFKIVVDDICYWENPYVIFLKVKLNSKLNRLNDMLESKFGACEQRHQKFKPHITLAYKDFNKTRSKQILTYLKEIRYQPKYKFTSNKIILFYFDKTRNKWHLLTKFKITK